MIEKNSEISIKSNSSDLFEENGTEISNYKLLYRKTPNPERDKSSGVSSDEETTSSSLVPIPDGLKQIKNKSKWTLSDAGEYHGLDTHYGRGINEKSTGIILNSLEELRQKYTLKNERSVALKVDSANMMLDDILNSANLTKISTESLHSKSFREQEIRTKSIPENESSITESSSPHPQPCPHIFEHSHMPLTSDFITPQCYKHCDAVQPFHVSSTSIEKVDQSISKGNFTPIQRKKSLIEKFQDLQIGCRIQSVYKILQKTKNPFSRNRKDSESISVQQGIPGAGYEDNVVNDNETLAYNCEHKCFLNHYPKKMILDLVEPNEITCSEFKNFERGDQLCTCLKQKECNCPEVIPRCACIEGLCKAKNFSFDNSKENLGHSETIVYTQATQPDTPRLTNKEDESSLFIEKENDTKKKEDSPKKNSKEWRKKSHKEKEIIERTDIYYFDHGNSAYYKTTDDHPKRFTEGLVESTDEYATKFWAEFFGTIEIGVAFLTSFILQLYRFLFTSLIRSLLIGLIQISSDYFFKPLLTILFNGIIQPCLILGYNIATSFRDLCLPISQTFGFYIKEIANLFRSCRLVDINHDRQSTCYCRNKKLFSLVFKKQKEPGRVSHCFGYFNNSLLTEVFSEIKTSEYTIEYCNKKC